MAQPAIRLSTDSLAQPAYAGGERWPALVAAVEQLAGAPTIPAVIDIVRRTARDISGADGITFVLRDGELCHYVDENAIGPLWKGMRFPLTACISGWAMIHGEMAVIPDIYQDARIPHDAYRPTFVKSLVMTPVCAPLPMAAIGAYWSEERTFSDEELALLAGLARSTAAAISAIHAREALAETEARLSIALAAGGLGAWEFDRATGMYEVSPAWRDQFGRREEHLTEADVFAAIHPEDSRLYSAALGAAMHGTAAFDIEFRIVRPSGEERWIEMRGRAVADVNKQTARIAGVTLDVTERRRMAERQAEMIHASRVNELGRMTAAFAHELNQPLAAAHNYLAAATRHLEGGNTAKAVELVGKADAQFERTADVIRRIRGLAEKKTPASEPQDVRKMIEEPLQVVAFDPRYRAIDIQIDVDRTIADVIADKVQIQQVILNLVRNAMEAMLDAPERRLVVSARGFNNAVEISVADTGPGLAPEVAARLFQPFVTTKEGGMGVGLSICQAIIEKHGGQISAAPRLGGGTVFSFSLPAGSPRQAQSHFSSFP